MSPLTVVYDACVLYPAALRDLLIRLAVAGLCRARWTDEILDEAFESLKAARPDLEPVRLAVTRRRMCEAVRECLVTGHSDLISSLELPDPEDRHVLAAAIRCRAQAIVTYNIKDFPAAALTPHGIRVLSPDELMLMLLETASDRVVEVVQKQTAALKNPPVSVEKVLSKLAGQGLERSVLVLEELLGSRRVR